MIKAGITGGIGSGKTVVSGIFKKLGVPVFFSDKEAAGILLYDKKIREKIVSEFGKEVLAENNIDKKKLAKIVFNDKEKLARLNSIVHPAVREYFENWEKKQKNVPYTIKEAAILLETGTYKDLDYVILVTAPENTRIKRVMKRDRISKKAVLARMENQWSDARKKKFADSVIVNDGKKMLLPQVLKIHEKIKRLERLKRLK